MGKTSIDQNLKFLHYIVNEVYDNLKLSDPISDDDFHRNLYLLKHKLFDIHAILSALEVETESPAEKLDIILDTVGENVSTLYKYILFEKDPSLSLKDNALLKVKLGKSAEKALDTILDTYLSIKFLDEE